MRALLLLTVLAATLCAGCPSGIGEFCFKDQDCRPGLRCSAEDGERGVCTYPEDLPDIGEPDTARDLGPEDGPGHDAAPDADGAPTDLDAPVETAPDTSWDLSPDALPDLAPAQDQAFDLTPPADSSPADSIPADGGEGQDLLTDS